MERWETSGLASPSVAAARRAGVFDPHVERLNQWVQQLRTRLPLGAEVPWFDPADGGIAARLLWLGEQPTDDDVFSIGGTGFVSLDGPGAASRNLLHAATNAGVQRSELVLWNASPCQLEPLKRTGAIAEVRSMLPGLLGELFEMLPQLEVVVLAGRRANRVYRESTGSSECLVLSTPAVRNAGLEARPRERAALTATWNEAAASVRSESAGTAVVLADGPDSTSAGVDLDGETTLLQFVGDREVIAFGSDAALAALGTPTTHVPSATVEAVRTASAALPSVAGQMMSGRIVMISRESAKLMKTGKLISGGGNTFIGTVKNARTGKFAGQLRFQDLGSLGASAVALPTLLSAVAMQQQMAAIERRLAAVQEQLDQVVRDRQAELEAALDTNLEILAEIFDRSQQRGVLEQSDWHRIIAIESRVRDFQKRTWSALGSLQTALDPERSAAARTKELLAIARNDGLDRQLIDLVKAELALTQWQALQLLHDIQTHPEELEQHTATFRQVTRERHELLVDLARRLDAQLGDDESAGLLDKVRSVVQRDAATFRLGLADVLDAYRAQLETLGLSAPPPPPAISELSIGDRVSDTVSAARSRLRRRKDCR